MMILALVSLSLLVSPSFTQTPGSCRDNPCFYGATCIDNADGGFTCTCREGYTGDRCGTPFDALGICATNNPCQNGGQCYGQYDNTYFCQCPTGFFGTNCEISSNPGGCMHEGRLYDTGSTRPEDCNTCTCYDGGWACTEIGCNPATCIYEGTSYNEGMTRPQDCNTCTCHQGNWLCSMMPCREENCYHGGVTYSNGGTRQEDCNTCTCFNGHWGCTDVGCNPEMCHYGSQVFDNGARRQEDCNTCTCSNGQWLCTEMACLTPMCPPIFDRQCSTHGMNMCQSDGGCMMGKKCCSDGCYKQCVTPVFEGSECPYNPCQNGAECVIGSSESEIANYRLCRHGFVGEHCEQSDNLCEPNPCMNGGTCFLPRVSGALVYCSCPYGYSGQLCQDTIGGNRCTYNPCQNNGTCTVSPTGSYICTCLPGFTGAWCENRPVCQPNPCMNGGICVVYPNSLTHYCNCAQGYSGQFCEVVIGVNPCMSNPCQNNGNCMTSSTGSYICSCPSGFVGPRCETRTACEPNPCMNGGTCLAPQVPGAVVFCSCPYGYSGQLCQDMIGGNRCTYNPCLNNGTCAMSPSGSYICTCLPGFTGAWCEHRPVCQPNPCMNGGTCMTYPNSLTHYCNCAQGYSGQFCEVVIGVNPCMSNPCQNNGNCTMLGTDWYGYACTCRPGFTGPRCETRTACEPNPCMNGGTCFPPQVPGALVYCSCPYGYSGQLCQDMIGGNRCMYNPCQNNGTCTVSPTGSYICTCLPGFTGAWCEHRPVCQPNPCMNGGTCMTYPNSLTHYCNCAQGYSGQFCEVVIGGNQCAHNPCQNGGTCMVSSVGSYICDCSPGFTGAWCETRPDDACQSSPCLNGATCHVAQGDGSHICQCPSGYYGEICQHFSGCLPNPCVNGGTCTSSTTGMFLCACSSGFTGERCETRVDMCNPNPCLNGGTCMLPQMAGMTFICLCADGYMGQHCQDTTGGNQCMYNHCLNGGTCMTSATGMSVCHCRPGFTGASCETRLAPKPGTCPPMAEPDRWDDAIDPNAQCPPMCTNDHDCHGSAKCCISSTCGMICITPEEGNPCDPNPCRNGGTCMMSPATGDIFFCTCPSGFTGQYCEQTTGGDPCHPNRCQNNGVCAVLDDGSTHCTCAQGYYGSHCQYGSGGNQCTYNHCMNGGTCLVTAAGLPGCHCRPGFTGMTCEIISPPKPGTCPPMAEPDRWDDMVDPNAQCPPMCTNDHDCHGSAKCCISSTCGMICITPEETNQCDPNPCRNGGRCMVPTTIGNHFVCTCPPGFTGQFCEQTVAPTCNLNPCLNGGMCYDLMSITYGCICTEAYAGKNCEIHKDSNMCDDGSRPVTCLVDPCIVAKCHTNPRAHCRPNFCGGCSAEFFDDNGVRLYCEDPCANNPCRNGGDCINVNGVRHVCNCPAGFYGTDCEMELVCENGQSPLLCLVDPCALSACPAHPTAQCRINACDRIGYNGCFADFFDEQGNRVNCYEMECPNNILPTRCAADPCLLANCLAHPDARCVPNPCPSQPDGHCIAEYFDSNNMKVNCEIGNICSMGQPELDEQTRTPLVCMQSVNRVGCGSNFFCQPASDNVQYGVCCPLCPDGQQPVFCFANPCEVETCVAHPGARCVANYCGGCFAYFYDSQGRRLDCDVPEPVCGNPNTPPCQNGGICTNGVCACPNGFVGRLCEEREVYHPKPGMCRHVSPIDCGEVRDECSDDRDCVDELKCCSNGCFKMCSAPVAEPVCGTANTAQCQNGGMCRNGVCECPTGFVGRWCEESQMNPCQYGLPAKDDYGRELFCGLGPNAVTCPDRHQCNVAPDDSFAVCCPEEREVNPCHYGQPAKDVYGRELFCGLGPNSVTCPERHQCNVAPDDSFAVCCPEEREVNPCHYGQPAKDVYGRELFCGLGPNSVTCPERHQCNVAPDDRYAVCCPEEREVNPCQYGLPAKDVYGRELFCGLGPNSVTCPERHQCNIAPDDRYAVCCPEDPLACPGGLPPVECHRDPCEMARCDQHPEAMCRANNCGACNAVFYDENDMPVECKDSCEHTDGERYIHGQTVEADGCNTCTCYNGMMACTLIFCGDTTSCNHSGIHFKNAEYRESGCEKCVCNNNDWVCFDTSGCNPDRELEKVSVTFKLAGSYDDIVGKEEEFKVELKTSISANFRVPESTITNLQISRGSIRVGFDLQASEDSDVNIETVVSNMENRIEEYTFVFDGTEYQADHSTAVFEKEYQKARPVDKENDTKQILIIVGIIAAVLFVLVLIMFITCLIAGSCKDRRRASRQRDYHANGKHTTPREIVNAFDNETYVKGDAVGENSKV